MSQFLCKGVQKLLGEWFFEAALLSKSKRAAMCEMCRWWVVGVNKSRTLPKKRTFIFCSSNPWYVEGGAYKVVISV